MATFVLVHGAWHGSWCWTRLAPLLQHRGHRVYAFSLTGCGDRAHLLSPRITLETHIADVANFLLSHELHDAILVVHSYAGMIGTAIADRHTDRLSHLVYLDAVLPKPGESWSSTHTKATKELRLQTAYVHPQYAFDAPDPTMFGFNEIDYAWVKRRQTPHPGRTYAWPLAFDPARVSQVARTYIDCTDPPLATIAASRQRARESDFWHGHWAPKARIRELATGHDPMISAPQELCAILCDL